MKSRKIGKIILSFIIFTLAFVSTITISYFNGHLNVAFASENECSCSDASHNHIFTIDGDTLTVTANGVDKIINGSCNLSYFVSSHSEIKKVIFSEGITEIDCYALCQCKNIISVVIPSTVNKISSYAFQDCYFLSNIEFKNANVAGIYNYAFVLTASKGTITVPVGTTLEYENSFPTTAGITIDENHWAIKEYSDAPKFNDGYENKNLTSESYVVGNKYTVHDDVSYTFAGWYNDKYYTSDAVTNFENNKTYYAKWLNEYGNTVVTTSVNYKTSPVSTLPQGSNITWNSESKTVTLNNVTIDTKEQVGLNLPANSTVTAIGNNTIRAIGNGDINNKKCIGIYSDQVGTLTINGTGNLNAYGGDLIYDVNEYVLNSVRISAGTYANGDIIISDVNFHSESGRTDVAETPKESNNYALYCCGYANGILCTGKITIKNTTVNAIARNASVNQRTGFSIGIQAYKNVEIYNSTVNASSDYAVQDTVGIYAGRNGNSFGNITAYGENDIFLANIIIDNSTVTAISGETKIYDTIGIYAHNNINIKNSTVIAKNGSSKGSGSTDVRATGIFHNEDLVIDNSNVKVEAYGNAIYTYTHIDETDEGKTAVFGRTSIINNSVVNITTLDDDGAGLTACTKLLIGNSILKCDIKTFGNVAIIFNDPNHATSTIEGLVISGKSKIITNGIVKVDETDSSNAYYFGNLNDKHYYVTNSSIEYLNGTTNIVTPKENGEMIIGISNDVTFDMSSHGTSLSSQKVYCGDKIVKPTDPTCDGYAFGGWFKDSSCTQAWNFESDEVTSNVTLYAKWTAVYTMTFDMNSYGTEVASQAILSGNKVNKPNDPTCDGYVFGGWFKDPSCTQAWNFESDEVTSNVTLYAKWTKAPTLNLWWIVIICVIAILLIIYIFGYFVLYRRGKLDEYKIKVIYKFLPRGNKNKK